jgi:hypothetical protein
MRILVQRIETGTYLTYDAQWTLAADSANDFPTTTLAYDFGRHISFEKFRVIFHFPDTGEFIHFIEGQGQADRHQLA